MTTLDLITIPPEPPNGRVMYIISSAATFFVLNPWVWNMIEIFVLGSLLESGRRIWLWLTDDLTSSTLNLRTTAEFTQGDRAYDWIILFLNEEKIWERSLQFRVQSKLGYGLGGDTGSLERNGSIYVPLYEQPQVFKWNGYWLEIRRDRHKSRRYLDMDTADAIYVSIYTFNVNVMAAFVEAARARYHAVNESKVTVHTAHYLHFDCISIAIWTPVKRTTRRPLSSIVLRHGVVDSLVSDVRDFLDSEAWYAGTGIPYRRGYLLYGPPGTGKTSTIYALAGELGLEIYTFTLSASFVNDTFLQDAVSSIPRRSILLLEDIDCAFPSRDEVEGNQATKDVSLKHTYDTCGNSPPMQEFKSHLTLSCLLNVIDGVGSDDGRVLIATTNYVDRLDPALLRPGRIDIKFEYKQTSKEQASALFVRFFSRNIDHSTPASRPCAAKSFAMDELTVLAERFASHIPDHEFSIAEIQGFLLACKGKPEKAVDEVEAWVKRQIVERFGRF